MPIGQSDNMLLKTLHQQPRHVCCFFYEKIIYGRLCVAYLLKLGSNFANLRPERFANTLLVLKSFYSFYFVFLHNIVVFIDSRF
ncbi:hypothetical protein CAP50_00425 [Psychrobacter sp. L7]|nr:hypothetical protein CAP50_00425 [Psychrobacter sp. L7]